jgi:hypothetical protein
MTGLVIGLALGLLIWALVSTHSIIRTLARILTGLLTLASAAAAAFLFKVGQQAQWTSDGPGMLLIMVGTVFCGVFALVFGGLFVRSLSPSS